jgi:uncharacterized membrane protein
MLVGSEGASLGFGIGASAASSGLLQYVATNRNTQNIRQAIIAPTLTYALLLSALLLALCMLPHAAGKRLRAFESLTRMLAPLCAAGFVPLLFQPELWKDKLLGFLLVTALFSIVVTISSEVSLRAASTLRSGRWVSDLAAIRHALRFRLPPKVVTMLSVASVALLGLYGVVTTFSATKAPLPAGTAEWVLLTKFSGYHNASLWFTPIGTRAIGHVSILGALYSVWAWIWPKPEGLLCLRLLAVSWPALPLLLWTRQSVGTRAAWFMAFAYLSLPLKGMLAANDLFPVSFSVGFFFLAAYYFESKRIGHALVATLMAIALHEQASIWFVTLGLFFVTREHRFSWGTWLMLAAALYLTYSVSVLLPGAGVTTYSGSTNAVANAGHALSAQQESLMPSLVNLAYAVPHWLDDQSVEFWLVLFVPLGFVPLRNSRWFVCLLPGLLWSFLSRSNSDWHTSVYMHFVTLGLVSAVISLATLKQSVDSPRARYTAVFAGWAAALLPCIVMFGTLWLPTQQ